MPPGLIIEPRELDVGRVVADRAAIRAINPHRFEMEMLDAILLLEPERRLIAGYRDVRDDEFWCRGHFPGMAVLPGVLMCESAAQLCSYYIMSQHVIEKNHVVGFGGMEKVRFRSVVRPGDRLVIAGRAKRLDRRQSVFEMQGFVNNAMAFHVDIIGVPLPMTRSG